MTDTVELRLMTRHDFAATMNVVRSLPEWFNDQGVLQMTVDLKRQPGVVAELDGELVGFATWTFDDHGSGEIGWIAVDPGQHRRGLGKRLLAFAEDQLRDVGVTEVTVETLGESVDYEPYERTRAFYRAAGFRDLRSIKTDNPGMPESLTLHKSISQPEAPGG